MQPSIEALQNELGQLARHLGRANRPGTGEVSRAEQLVLTLLLRGGPRRAGDLAQAEGMDASTVSRRLALMEERGFVERVADPSDRRASLVSVTAAGRAAHASESLRRISLITDRVADWAPADIVRFTELLARLNAAFEDPEEAHG